MKNQKGQTLIEILLAFSVAILVLSAIVIGVSRSLSNTQYTKNQNLANSYAQEGMTVVRAIRDSNWTDFIAKTQPIYCIDQNTTELRDPSPLLNCGQNVVGIFSREVKFQHDSDSCKADPACVDPGCLKGSRVEITVSWPDSKCPIGIPLCNDVELITCFSNLDIKPTP